MNAGQWRTGIGRLPPRDTPTNLPRRLCDGVMARPKASGNHLRPARSDPAPGITPHSYRLRPRAAPAKSLAGRMALRAPSPTLCATDRRCRSRPRRRDRSALTRKTRPRHEAHRAPSVRPQPRLCPRRPAGRRPGPGSRFPWLPALGRRRHGRRRRPGLLPGCRRPGEISPGQRMRNLRRDRPWPGSVERRQQELLRRQHDRLPLRPG